MCDVASVALDEREKAHKRELARLRQQKCRRKAKEEQQAVQTRLESLEARLHEAKHVRAQQQLQVSRARAKLAAVCGEQWSIAASHPQPTLAAPPLPIAHHKASSPAIRRPRATQAQAACSIFRKFENDGHGLRHRACISASLIAQERQQMIGFSRNLSQTTRAENSEQKACTGEEAEQTGFVSGCGRKLFSETDGQMSSAGDGVGGACAGDERRVMFMEDVIDSFRERTARRLGCRVADVCWLLESENLPALTRDGLITTHLESPACITKTITWWMATIVESALLLAMEKRLERCRCSDPFDDAAHSDSAHSSLFNSLAPQQTHDHSSSYLRDSLRATAADSNEVETGQWQRQESVRMPGSPVSVPPKSSFCFGSLSPSRELAELDQAAGGQLSLDESVHMLANHMQLGLQILPGSSEHGGGFQPASSRQDGTRSVQTCAAMRAVVDSVFDELLGRYIPQMHPADVLAVCRRSLKGLGAPSQARGAEALPEVLTAGLAFSVIRLGLDDALQRCIAHLRTSPVVPAMPRTRAAAERAVAALHQQMRTISAAWAVAFSLTTADRPSITNPLVQCVSPPQLGAVRFETVNVNVYKALKLTRQQKETLIAARKDLHDNLQAVNALQRSLVAQLEHLPSEPLLETNLRRTSRPGQHGQLPGPPSSLNGLLGACPQATETAARVLSGLRDCLKAKNDLFIRQHHVVRSFGAVALTATQEAEWFSCVLPLQADAGRIAQLASADIRCARVYGRPPLCAPPLAA